MSGIFLAIVLRWITLLAIRVFWGRGQVHYAYAWSHPWPQALVTPQSGSLNIRANLSAVLALLVPLEHAPLVTTLMAMLVQLIPIAFILWNDTLWAGWPRKLVGLAIYQFLPIACETRLNPLNRYSCFIIIFIFLLLLDPVPRGRARRWVYRALLVLCGLSGVASTFLLPFFALRWLVERERERLVQTLTFGAATLVQALAVFSYRGGLDFTQRLHDLPLSVLLQIIWRQTIGYMTFGLSPMQVLSEPVVAIGKLYPAQFLGATWITSLVTPAMLVLLRCCLKARIPAFSQFDLIDVVARLRCCLRARIPAFLLGGAFLMELFATLFFSASRDPYGFISPESPSRIFLVPNVILG